MTAEVTDEIASSYRQIVRSSSIMAGASAINIVTGLARVKAAALLLGPAGVGLIGLLQNLLATATFVASLGVGNAGSRQIAEAAAKGYDASVAASRRALLWITALLAVAGAAILWAARARIAHWLLDDASLADEIGWLSLGVGFGVAGASQSGLLTGLRRIGDVARVTVTSAIISAIAGVAILLWAGERGIVPFILLPPVSAFLAGCFYTLRLPRSPRESTRLADLARQWRVMAGLGSALMIGGAAALVGQLAVRILVQRELGMAELGMLQAAWLLSITYLGFVLQAMGADYYPRLTAAVSDPAAANRLINEQTEVALLLGAPALLGMLGSAPWVLQLFYSSAFTEAAALLRWQILGDLFKIASWPMSFLLLALGHGRTFVATEISSTAIFVLLAWLGIPWLGVEAAGVAFLGMYAFYLPLFYFIAKRKTGFAWTSRVKLTAAAVAAACSAVFLICLASDLGGLALAVVLAAAAGVVALRRLGSALPPSITALATRVLKLSRRG